MKCKSVIAEAQAIKLATELIEFGARFQVLVAEVHLSREKLLRLYKEIKKASPPKGMLPFSTEWFMTWQPNIHGSVFLNFYHFMIRMTELRGIFAVMKAYRLYIDHCLVNRLDVVLGFTRAWTLVRFYAVRMVTFCKCVKCHGSFVVHCDDLMMGYVCGLCNIPSRVGKKVVR